MTMLILEIALIWIVVALALGLVIGAVIGR